MRLHELTESIVTEGSEKFNDEVMRPGFRWSEEINGITYLVRTQWDNMPEVIAKVNNREVGRATFIDHHTRSGLESVSTYVSPKWQGHGIAKNMYAVMRMLGANIQPSATQTAMGKDMWAKWKKSGDTKHLTSMNAKMNTQDVAEEKQRLDAKCWDGYKKQGTKMKGDTRVNNCVPESIDADQKKARQVPATEMPKKTSPVLGKAPKQHPFKGRAVGGGL